MLGTEEVNWVRPGIPLIESFESFQKAGISYITTNSGSSGQ